MGFQKVTGKHAKRGQGLARAESVFVNIGVGTTRRLYTIIDASPLTLTGRVNLLSWASWSIIGPALYFSFLSLDVGTSRVPFQCFVTLFASFFYSKLLS